MEWSAVSEKVLVAATLQRRMKWSVSEVLVLVAATDPMLKTDWTVDGRVYTK